MIGKAGIWPADSARDFFEDKTPPIRAAFCLGKGDQQAFGTRAICVLSVVLSASPCTGLVCASAR